MTLRLLYLVSHPIQYQAPLLRRIAAQADIRLRVLFERDPALTGKTFDPGFGRDVVWDVPLRQGYDSALIGEVEPAAEIRDADVVWVHGWGSPVLRHWIRQAHRAGRSVLMRGENTLQAMPSHPDPRGWLKRLYLWSIFRRCKAFLAIGSANAAYYRAHGVDPRRIFMVPYAIDNDFFASRAHTADVAGLRAELGLAPNRSVILFSGKLMMRKKPHVLLQAWKCASWSGERPQLVFVGDGEMAAELRRQAGPDVFFAGFRNQTELPAFYALADVFVLASHAEPWGLAVNEAMAAGTAVIVSDQCGCAPDLVDSSCGAIVPAGDVEALSRALVQVIPDAARLGQNAAKKIAEWGFDQDVAGLREALRGLGLLQ